MVHALNNGGANSIWEHTFEKDSKLAKRKPCSTDSLEDKAEFVRRKHKNCEFIFRPNVEDGQLCVENELGKQLHASVRSNNLITSFRLLIQGADPNYFHDEKNSTPLHAAVKADQLLQVELLLIYGADPLYPDSIGRTPLEYAKQSVNKNILNRLIEAQYEVTDKFSNFLCHRKPDHEAGIEFLILPTGPRSSESSMEKLRKLSNEVFEELVKDVYDEVERRELEAIWLGSADTVEFNGVPFLPVDPMLSTTRNQSRQKLGRFASPELKALVHDILIDTQRRQKQGLRQLSQISDDDPLYDSVASDDDYAVVPAINENDGTTTSKIEGDVNQNAVVVDSADKHKIEFLTRKLRDSSGIINELKGEITNLRALIDHLTMANHELQRVMAAQNVVNGNAAKITANGDSEVEDVFINGRVSDNNNLEVDLRCKKVQRPSSMYETREGLRTPNWQMRKNQLKAAERNPQHQLVMQCTEQVTRGISELWKCIQGSNRDNCITYADKISFAVSNLAKAIPRENGTETVKHLLESVIHLQTNCAGLQRISKLKEHAQSEAYIQKIRSWAYEIAKDTKFLVTKYNSH